MLPPLVVVVVVAAGLIVLVAEGETVGVGVVVEEGSCVVIEGVADGSEAAEAGRVEEARSEVVVPLVVLRRDVPVVEAEAEKTVVSEGEEGEEEELAYHSTMSKLWTATPMWELPLRSTTRS